MVRRRKKPPEPQTPPTGHARDGYVVLVDGDNVSPELLAPLLDRLDKEAKVEERRIYRNWRSTKKSREWDAAAKSLAFERVDRYNTRREGKNASDIAVAVGAMDLFFDGWRRFCIVSGDTDFVPLVERIRRGGGYVVMVGHKSAPGLLEQITDEYIAPDELGRASGRRAPKEAARRGDTKKSQPAKQSKGARAENAKGQGKGKKTTQGRKPAGAGGKTQDGKPTKKQPQPQASKTGTPSPTQKRELRSILSEAYDSAMEEGRADDDGWIRSDQLGKMVRAKNDRFSVGQYGLPSRTSLTQAFAFFRDLFDVEKAGGGKRPSYQVRKRT